MNSTVRSLAVSLALCAMVLRALLPDGWMPAAGAATLTICSVDTQKPAEGKAPATPQRAHAPCAFASAVPFAPPAFISTLGVLGEAAGLAAVSSNDDFRATPDYRPNAARAPPALS